MLSTGGTIAYDKALTQPLWPFNSYVKSSLSNHTFDPYNALPIKSALFGNEKQADEGLEILGDSTTCFVGLSVQVSVNQSFWEHSPRCALLMRSVTADLMLLRQCDEGVIQRHAF